MSDSEKQDAEKDPLDDNIMNSIIQNEPFVPLNNEKESLTGPAFLSEPIGFFDRHHLIPEEENDDDNNNNHGDGGGGLKRRIKKSKDYDTSPSRRPRSEKRKRVHMQVAFAVPEEPPKLDDSSNFDVKAAKRRKSSCAVRFMD